jgi:hypothetical protein
MQSVAIQLGVANRLQKGVQTLLAYLQKEVRASP